MSKIEEISFAVQTGKQKLVTTLVQDALDEGREPIQILDAMTDAMAIIGEKFQNKEVFVPEMLISARKMKKGVEILKPHLKGASTSKHGKFIIGTAAGDLHDIGKNLVGLMVEAAGFELVDLGADVSPEQFVAAVQAHPDCKVVGMSALLTTTMDSLKVTIDAIKAAGCREQVKIMIGGAPITQSYADEIGADAYTADAGSAAVKAVELVS